MRMRAGFDPPEQAVARLRAAADLAAGHGSVALVRRCEDELRRRGIPSPNPVLERGFRAASGIPRGNPNVAP
jgi:hypothetical protein